MCLLYYAYTKPRKKGLEMFPGCRALRVWLTPVNQVERNVEKREMAFIKRNSTKKEAYDLTQGNITLHMVRLALPLILGNILQQFYNTADAFVIGRYAGEAEFAAIGVAGSVMNLFLFAIVGACSGISVLFAQLYGAGDDSTFRREHFLALVFGLALTLCASAAGLLAMPLFLRAVQTPQEIIQFVSGYLTIVLLSLPASYVYNFYSSLLRAVGKTAAALLILALAVVLNLALDLFFIAELGLGILGAAYATAAAQAASALFCALYLRWAEPELLFHRADCHMDKELLRRSFHLSSVTALSQSSLYIGKLLVQGLVNTAGTPVISAFTATIRIEGFANSFGDSGAAVTSVMVAQNLGAGKKERVRQCFRSSLMLLLVLGLVTSAVMFCTAYLTAGFVLGSASGAAFDNAASYLQIISLFYTFCFTGNTFAGYFEGRGNVFIPLIGAAGHMSLRIVLTWLFLSPYQLNALAVSTGIGWVLVNLFWSLRYFRQRAE